MASVHFTDSRDLDFCCLPIDLDPHRVARFDLGQAGQLLRNNGAVLGQLELLAAGPLIQLDQAAQLLVLADDQGDCLRFIAPRHLFLQLVKSNRELSLNII